LWRFRFDALSATLLWLTSAFALSVPFALFWSGPQVGLGSAIRLGLFTISVYAFLYVRFGPGEMTDDQVRGFFTGVLRIGALSAALACLDFAFQWPAPAGYGAQFVWLDSGVFRRAQGVFYEASTLGNLCAFVLQLIAVAMLSDGSVLRIRRSSLVLLSVPILLALVLSYSRASILNLITGMAVLLWIRRREVFSLRAAAIAVGFLATAAAVLTSAFPAFLEAWVLRATASLQYFAEAPNAVLSGRLSTWGTLLQFIAAHPLMVLVGTGYKTLPYSQLTGTPVVADNTWLSTLVETGLAGFFGLIVLNVAIVVACSRAVATAPPVRSFAATWFLCFWLGQIVQMTSADLLTYWRLVPVWFCVLALATRRT
jgi:O-antigen ligase